MRGPLLFLMLVACGGKPASPIAPALNESKEASRRTQTKPAPQPTRTIQVSVEKWLFRFRYPGDVLADELHLVQGETTELRLESIDVAHSLLIVGLMDAPITIPAPIEGSSSPTSVVVVAPQSGSYVATNPMTSPPSGTWEQRVVVESKEDYNGWLAERRGDHLTPAERGTRLFAQRGCVQCHDVEGQDAKVGPPLSDVYVRSQAGKTKFVRGQVLADLVGEGRDFPTVEDYLRDSMLRPMAHLVTGFQPVMPSFAGILSERDITDIIAALRGGG